MAVEINYSKILEDRSSFQIARTNPKLTGNVKFTVDGNDNMWLNSIDANDELSKDLYKRVAIDPSMSLSGNMFKFFNNGSTPSDIVFDLKESFDNTKTSNDFKDQYDFSNYFSGAKYLTSKRYDERMSYFAPLYLKKDVPEFFVIFKIEDPVNKKISDLKSEYPFNRETYIKEMFKKSSIIKTFDLRETTKVGKYIRDYIESDSFPESSLSVTYQEDESTEWNGILYDSGVIGSRGELLNEFYSTSAPLKRFEEFITGGFQRNGVILPNILNMEFIFNDDTSEIYDFNRYFGVYVNAIELSKFDVDLDRSYSERATWENTPAIRRQYKEWETASVSQANPNGVILAAKNTNLYLSDFKDIFTDKSNMFFNYVTDKSHNLYLPKLDQPYDIDYDSTGLIERFSGKIRLSNTNIKLNDFYGPGEVFIQDEGLPSKISGFSHSYIKIGSLSHLDEIKVYHLNGTRTDSNGRYDSIVGTSGYSLVSNPEDFYVYNDIDGITGFDTFYFNIDGSIQQVATALTGCLNGIRNSRFEAFAFNEYVFIKVNVSGDSDADYKIEFVSSSSIYNGITINGITGDSLISTLVNFKGGSRSSKNRLVISSDHSQKILDNIDDLLVRTKTGWSKIKKVSNYIDLVVEKNTATDLTRRTAISSFTDNIVLVLEQDSEPVVEYKNFLIKKKHRPSFGLLSFLPIKDFDFDFYSSEYLNFPVIDSYKHYYIPPNVDLLEEDTTYEVLGTGSIEYPIGSGNLTSAASTISIGQIYVPTGGAKKYTVRSGNPIVAYRHPGEYIPPGLQILAGAHSGSSDWRSNQNGVKIYSNDFLTAPMPARRPVVYNSFGVAVPSPPFSNLDMTDDNGDPIPSDFALNDENSTGLPVWGEDFSATAISTGVSPTTITGRYHASRYWPIFQVPESSILTGGIDGLGSMLDQSITFDVTIPSAGTYMVGFSSLAGISLSINGVTLYDSFTPGLHIPPSASYLAYFEPSALFEYKVWNVIPVDLGSGVTTINISVNPFGADFFGVGLEIYDATQAQLGAVTTDAQLDAYTIFTTASLADGTHPAYFSNSNSITNPIADKFIARLDGNEEYLNFEGFFTIKDPDKITAVLSDSVSKLKTKYLNGIAGSEYEYFKENESLDFSLRSKILPYITKWVATDGTDSRNNPYRLNSELVFGFNNFSPDHEDTSQNPSNFTHEWFYIESKFNYLNDAETAKLNNSYFDTSLNINDILTQEGKFTDYFTYTPEFGGKEIAETQTRYAPINRNNQGIYQAMFKGFKISFKDYIDSTNVDSSGKPKFNPNSNRFEDYKFTAILKPVKEDINDPNIPPIRYRLIEHKTFKFVILVVEVRLGSIDQINSDWRELQNQAVDNNNYLKHLSLLETTDALVPSITTNTSDGTTGTYTDVELSVVSGTGTGAEATVVVDSSGVVSSITVTIQGSEYEVDDELSISQTVIGGTTDVLIKLKPDDFNPLKYNTINGDYRFKFDSSNISDLTHTSLYSIKHKKYNNTLNNYSNVKLSSIIDISNSGANTIPSISNITIDAISNYPSRISDEIHNPGLSNFVMMYNRTFDKNEFIVHRPGTGIDSTKSKLIGSTDNTIIYSVSSGLKLIDDAGLQITNIATSVGQSYYRDNYSSKILSGGKLYYESLFEKISFASFKQYLNTLNPFIEYESYEYTDAGGLVSSTGNWFAEISDISTIIKNTAVLAVEDSDKPSNVAFNQKVGYTYETVSLDNSYELNRYDGGFSPLFKNLFTFNSKFKFTNNLITDLDLSNTLFNIDIDKFLTIKNFNHIKVANSKILSLEADDEFDPQYELINEIAIGRSDYDMLSSNWDYGFHHLYINKNTKSPASGALRVEEDDSFISKLLNLRETFELDFKDFSASGTDFQKVNNLNSVNIDEIEIVYVENDTDIKGIINIENAITRYLLNDGILAKFEQFLSVGSDLIGNYETVEKYAKDYILINILKLYEIEKVEFYEKLDKTLVEQGSNSNSNAIEFRFLNDKERFNEGYELNKNLGINKSKRLLLEFNLNKRLNSGLLISPKVKIKFI